MAAGPLRSRIRHILQLEDDPMLVSGKSLAIVLGGLLVAATAAVLYLPAVGQAEEATVQATESIDLQSVDGLEHDVLTVDSGGRSLADAISELNAKAKQDPIGASQPPLTAEEVTAAILGWDRDRFPVSDSVYDAFRKVAETRRLPLGAELDFLTSCYGCGEDGEYDIEGWWIGLNVERYRYLVRETKIRARHLSNEEIHKAKISKSRMEAQLAIANGQQPQKELNSEKFPTLEEQKLADLAYKRLGLEMEPIADEDLKRVQVLGYDGGLKVVSGIAGLQGRSARIQPGDILVGLHVWPTTTMKALAEVLNRDDLAELNPLKFYIVRQGEVHAPNEEPRARAIVVTGRVSVNLSDGMFGRNRRNSQSESSANTPQRIETQLEQTPAQNPQLSAVEQRMSYNIQLESLAIELEGAQNRLKKLLARDGEKNSQEIAQLQRELQNKMDQYYRLARLPSAGKQENPSVPVFAERPKEIDRSNTDTLELRTEVQSNAPNSSSIPVEKMIEQILASDPQMSALQQELMLKQYQRSQMTKNLNNGQNRASAQMDRQIAGLEQQIAQYRNQVTQQITQQRGGPFDPNPQEQPRNYPNDIDRPYTDTLELRTDSRSEPLQDRKSATEPDLVPSTSMAPRGEKLAVRDTASTPERSILIDPSNRTNSPITQTAKANRANLRYDGKSFDQWRDIWRNELSTERRLEAVKALAAFGAAGYGKEAAEVILDIVKQYDWSVIGGSTLKFKNEAISAFSGSRDVTCIPMDAWLPVMAKELGSDDKRVGVFASYVFANLNANNAEVIPQLIELSRDEAWKKVRPAMLLRLQEIYSDSGRSDQRIRERMIEALGEEPAAGQIALGVLYPSNKITATFRGGFRKPDDGRGSRGEETIDLEYRPGQETIDLEYRPELLGLLERSEGPSKNVVIDILLRLGPKAKPALPQLLPLILELDNQTAAILTLRIPMITGSDEAVTDYLNAVVEKSESPEKVKRAQAMLRGLQTTRDRESQGSGRVESSGKPLTDPNASASENGEDLFGPTASDRAVESAKE